MHRTAQSRTAIIFDIDGTLLDTADFIISAFLHVAGKYSLALRSAEYVRSMIGIPLATIYSKLAPDFSTEEIDALCKEHVEFQANNIHLVKIYPNVKEVLALLNSRSVPMGIFTSRRSASVLSSLKHAEIDVFFNTVVAGDHVQCGKPHPEGVQKALRKLGAEPSRAFMVGDIDIDILCGKSAGVKTIAVSWGMRGRDVYSYEADFVIDSIKQLPSIIFPKEINEI